VLVNGVDLVVIDEGAGDVPLVLVHGFTGGASDWDDVAPALAEKRRVIRYDHRGHAGSHNFGDESAYTFDTLVGDLHALVDALGLEQFDLLGHSMGGVTAMRYVLTHPDRVRSLILMDTGAAISGIIPIDFLEGFANQAREAGSMQPVADAWSGAVDTMQAYLPEARRAELKARLQEKMSGMDPEAFVGFARALNTYPSMVDDLKTIACPTTVIVGENDHGLREASDVMAQEIPGAELVVIPGAGHGPQEDDPAAWLEAVEKHLSRV
jgi:pimeloyl-ACP methyl ester carboxylesterase